MYCLLCGNPLKEQDIIDCEGFKPIRWCTESFTFNKGERFHFLFDEEENTYIMIVPPYRVTTYNNKYSMISKMDVDHNNIEYFKQITNTVPIIPCSKEDLLSKINIAISFL